MNEYEKIYKYFKESSKEEVDSAIEKLSKEEKELLKLRFSNKWDNKYKRSFYYIISKIKLILKNKDINYSNGRQVITIYQIFNMYSKEEVDKVIESLNDNEKYLLYLKYGNDLSNPNLSNWDSKYSSDLYKKIMPKIRYRLKTNRIKSKEVIKIKPQVNGNNKLEMKILDIENNLLGDDNILLEKFSKKEILIYILVQKMDGSYNMNDLVNYFEVDRKYILKIVKNILESLVTTKCLIKR